MMTKFEVEFPNFTRFCDFGVQFDGFSRVRLAFEWISANFVNKNCTSRNKSCSVSGMSARRCSVFSQSFGPRLQRRIFGAKMILWVVMIL